MLDVLGGRGSHHKGRSGVRHSCERLAVSRAPFSSLCGNERMRAALSWFRRVRYRRYSVMTATSSSLRPLSQLPGRGSEPYNVAAASRVSSVGATRTLRRSSWSSVRVTRPRCSRRSSSAVKAARLKPVPPASSPADISPRWINRDRQRLSLRLIRKCPIAASSISTTEC